MSNIARIREQMGSMGVSAMLISNVGNLQWATGFTGSSGLAVITADGGFFVADGRYTAQAESQVPELELVGFGPPNTQAETLSGALAARGITQLGFETNVTYGVWKDWQEKVAGVEWIPQPKVLGPLRQVKTAAEIATIETACKLADATFDHVRRMIQVGVSEYDIALDIEFFIRRNGAKLAFEVISVSGPNSALPHGKPTERKLQPGDFLTLDFGAQVDGYCSDLTRTLMIGDPTPQHLTIYNRVLEAQIACCAALKPGANGREVDAIARQILDQDDLAKYFTHGLGHGLGREVHDGGGLGMSTDQPIEVGQVWTIEPGVYIPEFGGVRIEDDVVVEADGPRVLTHSPKELIVV